MEKNKEEKIKELQDLVSKLKKQREQGLIISRIPPKTKEAFLQLATDEFCGDYGMTLKWLMDDLISGDLKEVIAKITEMDNRLRVMEAKQVAGESQEEKKNIKKMCSGKERRIGRNG